MVVVLRLEHGRPGCRPTRLANAHAHVLHGSEVVAWRHVHLWSGAEQAHI